MITPQLSSQHVEVKRLKATLDWENMAGLQQIFHISTIFGEICKYFKYALSINSLMDKKKKTFFSFHHYITTTTFTKQIEICLFCLCVCVRPTSGEHVGEVRLCASEARISIITGQQVLLCAIRARHSASLLQTVVLLQESCVFTRRKRSPQSGYSSHPERILYYSFISTRLSSSPRISPFSTKSSLYLSAFWAEFY